MSAAKGPIIIASASTDEHAYGPVCEKLESRGYQPVVYCTDRVLEQSDDLVIDISSDGELGVSYKFQDISPQRVSSAWYRKVGSFSLPNAEQDRAKSAYLHNEIGFFNQTLWSLYPDQVWLNSPNKIREADQKLGQLIVARQVGFSIPPTVAGNSWPAITGKLFAGDNDEIVAKMVRGVISDNDVMKAQYTTKLGLKEVQGLSDTTVPFPGLYQPLLSKAREWRVTAVGENVFSAAIYTDEVAKVDWRLHQTTSAVRLKSEDLPEGTDQKCIDYLGVMGLKFGAFDIVETPDDELVFLECNPNGQYGWLEEELGFPISEAITNELIKIAQDAS